MVVQSDKITWQASLDVARERARQEGKALLLDFRAAPSSAPSVVIDTVPYPDPRVASFIRQYFVAVRVALRSQLDVATCSEAGRGPVLVLGGGGGEVHYRVDGTLPPEEFVAQLGLGLGRYRLDRQEFAEAIGHFREVADRYTGTRAAAQALLWLCVAQYAQATDRSQLQPCCEEFTLQRGPSGTPV
jgi:hypothetical protein